jgi:hypothetical protein
MRGAGSRSGYGSSALSPPDTLAYSPLPQLGHGGKCFVEPTSSSLPHSVQR